MDCRTENKRRADFLPLERTAREMKALIARAEKTSLQIYWPKESEVKEDDYETRLKDFSELISKLSARVPQLFTSEHKT